MVEREFYYPCLQCRRNAGRKGKISIQGNTGAAVLGLGYIVGLKYASIICAGSLAVWWIIIPGMSAIWGDSVLNAWNPEITSTVGMMSPEEIFKYYAKSIGIGGIAMAGVIGGGGLGKVAINYGYYRYNLVLEIFATALLVVLVQVLQSIGTRLATRCDKRVQKTKG